MKVKVPFHYLVYYTPFRKQNSHSTYFAAETEIEIREVPRAATKTVLRVGTVPNGRPGRPEWKFNDPYCAKPDGSMREIVSFEDGLWVESLPFADVAKSLAEDAGKVGPFATIGLRATTKPDASGQLPEVTHSRDELERSLRASLRSFSDDGGAQMRSAIERRARATIVVDETVYVRCREPVLHIDRRWGRSAIKFAANGHFVRDIDLAGYCGSAEDEEHHYNLNEERAGIAEVKRRHPEAEFERIAMVEIIDASVIRATPHVDAVLAHARHACTELWRFPLAMLPDTVDRAVELRDALSASEKQITPRLLRALEDIESLPEPAEQQLDRWAKQAATRPNRPGEHGTSQPIPSRASQIIRHIERRSRAIAHAADALRRFRCRPSGLSWEARAFAHNVHRAADDMRSVELISAGIVELMASQIGVSAKPLLETAERGGRVFAVIEGEHQIWNPPLALVCAEARHGDLQVEDAGPEHACLVRQHIATALAAEPHLAPAREQPMEMAR